MQKMENVSEGVYAGSDSARLTATAVRFIVLLAVAIFAPALGTQLLTGTLVNATLFVATAWLGVGAALLIGILPSVVSSVTGLLPAMMVPMVPFIMLGNAVLILSFSMLRKKSYWGGAAAGSLLKFALLSVVSSYLIASFVGEKAADKVALMMSTPQLYTALSGGVLAYLFLGVLKKEKE
jgi:hypothetical protein